MDNVTHGMEVCSESVWRTRKYPWVQESLHNVAVSPCLCIRAPALCLPPAVSSQWSHKALELWCCVCIINWTCSCFISPCINFTNTHSTLLHKQISGLIQRLQHSIRNIRIHIGWRYINVCILRSFKEIFYDYSTSNIDSNIQKVEVFSCLIPKVLVVLHIMMLHFLVCPKNAH